MGASTSTRVHGNEIRLHGHGVQHAGYKSPFSYGGVWSEKISLVEIRVLERLMGYCRQEVVALWRYERQHPFEVTKNWDMALLEARTRFKPPAWYGNRWQGIANWVEKKICCFFSKFRRSRFRIRPRWIKFGPWRFASGGSWLVWQEVRWYSICNMENSCACRYWSANFLNLY